MVKITVLPPQEEPSKPTAQAKINSLGEHLRAFMNKNNISGFIKEDDAELGDDTVAGLLSGLMFGPGLYADKVRERAAKLYRISMGKIPNRLAKHLVFCALGYKDATHARKVHGPLHDKVFIPNISVTEDVQRLYSSPDAAPATERPVPAVAQPPKASKKLERYLAQYDHNTDPTDSFRAVSILSVARSDGTSVGIRTLQRKEVDPYREQHTVSLADGGGFSILLDMERMSIEVQALTTPPDLEVDLGVSLCNLNRRWVDDETRSAAGALLFSRSQLRETEYFNRKLRLGQLQ